MAERNTAAAGAAPAARYVSDLAEMERGAYVAPPQAPGFGMAWDEGRRCWRAIRDLSAAERARLRTRQGAAYE